ncbi:MAG: hypothetical protein ABI977_30500 [Acidobacteriota bacterium]
MTDTELRNRLQGEATKLKEDGQSEPTGLLKLLTGDQLQSNLKAASDAAATKICCLKSKLIKKRIASVMAHYTGEV